MRTGYVHLQFPASLSDGAPRSPRAFNQKPALVIGLPMTTAQYNADIPFAVAGGIAQGRRAGKTSYVLVHQPKSFKWRLRRARARPLKRLADLPFAEVLARLNQIVNLA